MKVLVAGGEIEAERLAAAAREAEIEAALLTEPPGAAGSVATLAERLREVEAKLTAQAPDAVLLVDDTDTALAALLVATKLCVTAAAVADIDVSSPNGRVIVQLAERRLAGEPRALADCARTYTEPR